MTFDESREGEIPIRAQSDNQPPPKIAIPYPTYVPIMARIFGMDEDWSTPVAKPQAQPRPRHHVAGAELWLFNDTGVLVRGTCAYTLTNPTAIEIAVTGDILSAWYLEESCRAATPVERALWREALSRQHDYQVSMTEIRETLQFIAAAIGTLPGAPGADQLDEPTGAIMEVPNEG